MVNDNQSLNTQIALIAQDVKYIKKALDGNGEPGLISDTRKNTDYRVGNQAKSKLLLGAIGSGWLLAIIILVLQFSGVV